LIYFVVSGKDLQTYMMNTQKQQPVMGRMNGSPAIMVTGPQNDDHHSVMTQGGLSPNPYHQQNNLCPPSVMSRRDSTSSINSIDWSMLESQDTLYRSPPGSANTLSAGSSQQRRLSNQSVGMRHSPDSPNSMVTAAINGMSVSMARSPTPSYYDTAVSTPLPPSPLPGTPRTRLSDDEIDNFDLNQSHNGMSLHPHSMQHKRSRSGSYMDPTMGMQPASPSANANYMQSIHHQYVMRSAQQPPLQNQQPRLTQTQQHLSPHPQMMNSLHSQQHNSSVAFQDFNLSI
jgi:hypothetical protein